MILRSGAIHFNWCSTYLNRNVSDTWSCSSCPPQTQYAALRGLAGVALDSVNSDADCGEGRLSETAARWQHHLLDLSRAELQSELQELLGLDEDAVTPEQADFRAPGWRLLRAGEGPVRGAREVSSCGDQGYFRSREQCGEYRRCLKKPGGSGGLELHYRCPSGRVFDDR